MAGGRARANALLCMLPPSQPFSSENQAPNYSGIVRPKLLIEMDRRLNGGTVGAGTAAIWELESFLAVDSTQTLDTIQIELRGPWSNANRPQQLYVLAISAIPEPGAVSLPGVGALVVGSDSDPAPQISLSSSTRLISQSRRIRARSPRPMVSLRWMGTTVHRPSACRKKW